MTHHDDRVMLKPAAAAKFLGVGPEGLAEAERDGLPRITVGRAVRYRRSDLVRWLAAKAARD